MRNPFAGHFATHSIVVAGPFPAAATILLGWVLFAPDQHPVVSSPPPAAWKIESPAEPTVADTTTDDLISRASERDPFAGTLKAAELTAAAPEPPAVDLTPRVLGTVVDSIGGSFALCQLGAAQPVMLRVGQRIGMYALRSVGKGSAIFVGSDGSRLERRVPRAGA